MTVSRTAYIVGGGIAGLAAAALLIRDGGFSGSQIRIFEQLPQAGGSLDGAGDAATGYLIRGGRMFEAHFGATFDLFSNVPSIENPGVSVTDEILAFTRKIVTSSKSRLVSGGRKIDGPSLDLSLRDRWDLGRLSLRSEATLRDRTIEDYFRPGFFESNFWCMWCTMFAFRRWHSLAEFRRYMRRFMHLLPGFNRLEGIHRTVLNQFDSLVVPLVHWLESQQVVLETSCTVLDVQFIESQNRTRIRSLSLIRPTGTERIEVEQNDLVFVTLGSMTEDATQGSMNAPAVQQVDSDRGAWALWRRIASHSTGYGNPEVFCGSVERSRWQSFTVTLNEPVFFEFMERYTGNSAGTGGLVTFRDSNWLMSVVLPHQPHFRNQQDGVFVFWGYGLHPERPGNLTGKPMFECSGREILQELFHHLPAGDAGSNVIDRGNCIPCIMPFITSQFMPRQPGDRPQVVPVGAANFAFLGQYSELPEDCVFTVEYSIRTAQTAVSQLLHVDDMVTPMYHGYLDPRVVLKALRALS